eukprot:5867016-Prymnesium_polylepis.2
MLPATGGRSGSRDGSGSTSMPPSPPSSASLSASRPLRIWRVLTSSPSRSWGSIDAHPGVVATVTPTSGTTSVARSDGRLRRQVTHCSSAVASASAM